MTQHPDTSPATSTDTPPATVAEFMTAHTAHDGDTAISYLTDDAVVVDQGETFQGRDRILAFLRSAGSEFEYTTEQLGTRRLDTDHWVVTVRLEGTFPGGVAELDYRFTLREDRIAELVIANH